MSPVGNPNLEAMSVDELIAFNVDLKRQINELHEQKAAIIAVLNRKVEAESESEVLRRAGLSEEEIAVILERRHSGGVNVTPGTAHLELKGN